MTDPMYQGEYNGSRKHDPDLEDVLDRARTHGLQKLIVTAGTLEDSKKALDLARQKGLFLNIIFVSPLRIVESVICGGYGKVWSNKDGSFKSY
jgi:TatD DNase family protein